MLYEDEPKAMKGIARAAEARDAQVLDQLSRLDSELYSLRDVIGELVSRLGPVINPCRTGCEECEGKPEAALAPMAEDIRSKASRTRDMASTVRDALNSLEI